MTPLTSRLQKRKEQAHGQFFSAVDDAHEDIKLAPRHEIGTARNRPRSILTEEQWRSIANALHLSSREFDVLMGIVDGRKELAIAQELGISPHTVHAHVQRIYGKLGVHGHSELIFRVFATYISLESLRPVTMASRHTA